MMSRNIGWKTAWSAAACFLVGCVVDGVDPDRTPILDDGQQCAANEILVRSAAGWSCMSPSTLQVAGLVDEERTPVLPENERCEPGQTVLQTESGWTCGGVGTSSLSVTLRAPAGCGPEGGERVDLLVDGHLSSFEVCNGPAGADGAQGPPGPATQSGYRARARIDLLQDALSVPVDPVDSSAPQIVGDAELEITDLPGSAPNVNLRIPCDSGMAGDLDCDSRDEHVGASFRTPTASLYEVCVRFNHRLSVEAPSFDGRVQFLLAITPNASPGITQRGVVEVAHGMEATGDAVQHNGITVCDRFSFDGSMARGTVRLAYWLTGDVALSEITGPIIFDIERLRPL